MPPTAPDSSAAQIITALSWWTVVSPAAVLAATVLCARRPRLRGALTAAALLPALLTLLPVALSLIHISEPTRLLSISYAVFCLKKKNNNTKSIK